MNMDSPEVAFRGIVKGITHFAGGTLEKSEVSVPAISTAASIVSRQPAEPTKPRSFLSAAGSPSDIQKDATSESDATASQSHTDSIRDQAAENGKLLSQDPETVPTETAEADADSPTQLFPLSSITEETASQEREANRSTGNRGFSSESAAAGPCLLEDDAALDIAIDAVLLAAEEEGRDPPSVPTFEAMDALIPKSPGLPLAPEIFSEGAAAESTKPAVANLQAASNTVVDSRHITSPPALPTVPETEVLTEPTLPPLTESKPADKDGGAVQSAEEALAGLSLAGIPPTQPLLNPGTGSDQMQARGIYDAPASLPEKSTGTDAEEKASSEEEQPPPAQMAAPKGAALSGEVHASKLHSQSAREPLQIGSSEAVQSTEEGQPSAPQLLISSPGCHSLPQGQPDLSLQDNCVGASKQADTEPEPESSSPQAQDEMDSQLCDGSQADSEGESSDEESYAVRPKLPAPGVFTSRLLDDYAAICTPVRGLPASQSRQQDQAVEAIERSPQKVVRPLALPSDELGASISSDG